MTKILVYGMLQTQIPCTIQKLATKEPNTRSISIVNQSCRELIDGPLRKSNVRIPNEPRQRRQCTILLKSLDPATHSLQVKKVTSADPMNTSGLVDNY